MAPVFKLIRMGDVLTIIRKNRPVTVIKMRVGELDEPKLSSGFKSHGFGPDTEVYVKCDAAGRIEYRGKAREYRLYEVAAHKIKTRRALREELNHMRWWMLPALLFMVVPCCVLDRFSNSRWYCTFWGWHKAPEEQSFDGCSVTGKCGRCGHPVMKDSQGNWF